MANLQGRTTSGDLAFDKYVANNPRWNEIDFDIEKDTVMVEENGNELELIIKGSKVKILENCEKSIKKRRFVKVCFNSIVGFVCLDAIRKPTRGDGTHFEDAVVLSLNSFFTRVGKRVNIQLDGKLFKNLYFASKVGKQLKKQAGLTSDPKADIVIHECQTNPLLGTPIFVSLKQAGGPEAFQQYGGVSNRAGNQIHFHPEVQTFFFDVSQRLTSDGLGAAIMKKVECKTLINMSIYGPEFEKEHSLNHVHMIGQGMPVVEANSKSSYSLGFESHYSFSGCTSKFTGSYTPVFGATNRKARGFLFQGTFYSGVRVAVYPSRLLEKRTGVISL
jgi:hypothetical protein